MEVFFLAARERRREQREQLALMALAFRGEPKALEQALKDNDP